MKCNNETGRKWDASLVKSFKLFCSFFLVTRENGRTPKYKFSISGDKHKRGIRDNNGEYTLYDNRRVVKENTDKGRKYKISGTSKKEITDSFEK